MRCYDFSIRGRDNLVNRIEGIIKSSQQYLHLLFISSVFVHTQMVVYSSKSTYGKLVISTKIGGDVTIPSLYPSLSLCSIILGPKNLTLLSIDSSKF